MKNNIGCVVEGIQLFVVLVVMFAVAVGCAAIIENQTFLAKLYEILNSGT